MSDEQHTSGWRLEKTINVGYLLTAIVMFSGLVIWAMKMDNRVSIVEVQQVNAKENENKNSVLLRDNFKDIKDSQQRVEEKLDTKADKQK